MQGKGPGATAKSAPGTKAVLKTGFFKKRNQMRYAETSHGHVGLADHQRLHFGLGKSKKAIITVYWNSGPATYKIPANRFIKLTEGNPKPEISDKPF